MGTRSSLLQLLSEKNCSIDSSLLESKCGKLGEVPDPKVLGRLRKFRIQKGPQGEYHIEMHVKQIQVTDIPSMETARSMYTCCLFTGMRCRVEIKIKKSEWGQRSAFVWDQLC